MMTDNSIENGLYFDNWEELCQFIIDGLKPLVNGWMRELEQQNKLYYTNDFIYHHNTILILTSFIGSCFMTNNTKEPQPEANQVTLSAYILYELFKYWLPKEIDPRDIHNNLAKIGRQHYDSKISAESAEDVRKYTVSVGLVARKYVEVSYIPEGLRFMLNPDWVNIYLNPNNNND